MLGEAGLPEPSIERQIAPRSDICGQYFYSFSRFCIWRTCQVLGIEISALDPSEGNAVRPWPAIHYFGAAHG